jgi:hypothetical protein
MIFATASGYWSWGNTLTTVGTPQYYVTASTGPWLAGSLWSTYPVPCNCYSGFCYSYCYVGSQQVKWGSIPPEAACAPQSTVYEKWAGPLGYCSFPPGQEPTTGTPKTTPANTTITGEDTFGGTPSGTVFNTPSQTTAIQGLTVTACITLFFAALAGCADSGVEGGSIPAAMLAAFFSLASFVFILASYTLWSDFPYVENLQSQNPSLVWMPVWINPAANQMTAVQVANVHYGPGWATALTASILAFFPFVIHCLSLGGKRELHPSGPTMYASGTQPTVTSGEPVLAKI